MLPEVFLASKHINLNLIGGYDMAKKVMQIEVYDDGSMKILDTVKTEAAGKSIEAEETTWKKFHEYLKNNEAKDAVADAQFTVIVTNPCSWVYYLGRWWCVCW
jgi:hypothetical protein